MIAGTFERMASSGDIPKGSDTEGIMYTSDIANIFWTSAPRRNPVKWKRSDIPNLATWRMQRFIISPLPAITKRTPFVLLRTFAAASMKYSGPFWKVIRPRKVTTLSRTPLSTFTFSRPLKSTAL